GLGALMKVPPRLARIFGARQSRTGRMGELHVDHADAGEEGHVRRVGLAVAGRGPGAEAPLVEPDLPQLAGLVVDVAVGDEVRLFVDEEDALAVGVLGLLGDALEPPGVARIPT